MALAFTTFKVYVHLKLFIIQQAKTKQKQSHPTRYQQLLYVIGKYMTNKM